TLGYYGDEFPTIARGVIEVVPGLGFFPGVIVDQHFIRRERLNRLLAAVLERPTLLGIGIDESTALEVGPDGIWTVRGASSVVVIDARRARVASAARPLAAAAPPTLAGQGGTASVTGRVVDSATAQPVSGARVSIVGTVTGTLTDRDGRYLLSGLPAGQHTLRVQRIGLALAEATVTLADGGTVTQDFVLSTAATLLSEVVVTGYGTTTRAEISGAVASVRGEDLKNTPLAGVDAAIQGRAAGVQVIQNAGNPGAGITVRIRGSASISASNQPLYVVDGVPLIRDDFSQLDVGGQDITGVTGLNPDEIENIDIL